jgi:hypothetical protein
MIRLTLRQFRASALTVYAALAVIAVVLAVTGPRLTHFYDAHIAGCQTTANQCTGALLTFLSFYHAVQASLGPILLVLPALIGIFWGAPLLAHELETGTYRLAWTQSLTRGRWLAVKLGVTGLAAMAAAGLLSLMVTWWFSPIDQVNLNRFTPAMFGERGIVPIGYAAFAFAFGVTAGLLIRRTVPAMATTLVAFFGARVGMTYELRQHLMPPARASSPVELSTITGPAPPGLGSPSPADWVLSSHTVNAAGQVIGSPDFSFQRGPGGTWLAGVGRCPNIPASTSLSRTLRSNHLEQACIDRLGIHQELIYQPISRFWAFQGIELAIFLAAALALAGLCYWWVRRRLT